MTAKNEHTGAYVNTKAATDLYREGFERIFGKKEKVTAPYPPKVEPGSSEPQNSPIQGESVKMVRDFKDMSDREWAALPANLREGCTVHVEGVGDL